LICFFDCLHDVGDPVGAARHAKRALGKDSTVMLVEPFANDRVEENLKHRGPSYCSVTAERDAADPKSGQAAGYIVTFSRLRSTGLQD
jgi:hypothetical protein